MYGPPLTRSRRCITNSTAYFTLINVIVMITPRLHCYVSADLMYKGSPADMGYKLC